MKRKVMAAFAAALCVLLVTPVAAFAWGGHYGTAQERNASGQAPIAQSDDGVARAKEQKPEWRLPQDIVDWLEEKAAELAQAEPSVDARADDAATPYCWGFVDADGDGVCDNSAWGACRHHEGGAYGYDHGCDPRYNGGYSEGYGYGHHGQRHHS